jgi:hypothetical protein
MISLVSKLFLVLLHSRLFPSPAKSWRLPSYAEDVAQLQALQVSPPLLLDPPPKYDSRVLKYIDVAAEVDFDLSVSQTQPSASEFEEGSMSQCTSMVNNGLIYVDDEAISE